MKRNLAILLIGLSLAAMLTGCHKHTEEVIPSVKATCTETGLTEGKKCSECGEITVAQGAIPALGHTTRTALCKNCLKDFATWEASTYSDGAWMIEDSSGGGKFNKGSVTDGELWFRTVVDVDDIWLQLIELGDTVVTNPYGFNEYYSLKVSTEGGAEVTCEGVMNGGRAQLFLDRDAFSSIVSMLEGEVPVKFYVEKNSQPSTNYTFEVETNNFFQIYAYKTGK